MRIKGELQDFKIIEHRTDGDIYGIVNHYQNNDDESVTIGWFEDMAISSNILTPSRRLGS